MDAREGIQNAPPPLQSPPSRQVPDRYAPDVFDGSTAEPEAWLSHFKRYMTYRRMTEEEQRALFPLFLKGVALDWYDNLGDGTRLSMRQLLSEYRGYFCPTNLDRVLDPDSIFSRVQKPQEKARDYVAVMQKLARRLPGVDDEMLRCMVVRGLRPHLKAFVLQQNPTSMGQLLQAARFPEATGVTGTGSSGGELSELMDEVRASRAEVRQLTNWVNRLTTNSVQARSPTPERRPNGRTPPRQVRFSDSSTRCDQRPAEDKIRSSVAVGVSPTHCVNRFISRSCHGPPRSLPCVGAVVGNMTETARLRNAPATHATGEVIWERPAGALDAHASMTTRGGRPSTLLWSGPKCLVLAIPHKTVTFSY